MDESNIVSCNNCQLRVSQRCTDLSNNICSDFRIVPFISREEIESWPDFGLATQIRLNGKNYDDVSSNSYMSSHKKSCEIEEKESVKKSDIKEENIITKNIDSSVTANDLVDVIEFLIEGINPLTGEEFDLEKFTGNKEILAAISKLKDKLRTTRKSTYEKYEDLYPNYVIIQKEGVFYSAHNNSALVLNDILNYTIYVDFKGRDSTGGPDATIICDALRANRYKYIIIEKQKVTEKYDGKLEI